VITSVNTEVVAQIVESVFLAMLNLEVCTDDSKWEASPDALTSFVELSGDWTGALLFECNRWQACQLTGLFLSVDPPHAVDDEVRDVIGELANMIGGNLKCAMANGLSLSMPTVMNGNDCHSRFPRFVVQDRLAFLCAVGPFWVTLLTDRKT
jgi:chemotaxis protein CheX